ncbi:flavodoxin family protein [Candidatus Hodarchaeum mangrovi]
MNILIVFASESGHTRKVTDELASRLDALDHTVVVKHALTVKPLQFEEADLILVGTPVHGYILFGQKPAFAIRQVIQSKLPENLMRKPVIGFATYLFFPARTLNSLKNAIEKRNGIFLKSFTKRRTQKEALVQEILNYLEKNPIT